MEIIQFFYFPFTTDQDTQKVIPQFEQESVLKAASMGNVFRLKIHGPANLLNIHQVATIIETWLNVDYLEWEFIERETSNCEIFGVLHIWEVKSPFIENALHPVMNLFAQYLDNWFSLIVENSLISTSLIRRLSSYGLTSNVLYKLLSLADSLLLQENHFKNDFNTTMKSLNNELQFLVRKIRSSFFNMLEDNNFISARYLTILIEVTYLFSLLLNGLSSLEYNEFINGIKAFHSSFRQDDDYYKIDLSILRDAIV